MRVVAVRRAGRGLVEPDRGDLGVAVGDPRDPGLVDRGRVEAGDVLGHEDALLEAAVGQLQPGHDVADGVHAVEVGAAPLVGEHEAALHGDALLVVAEPVGRRAAPDGDQEQLGLDHVAALDGDGDAVVGDLDALERRAGADLDLALLEGPLERLGRRLVLGGHQPGQRLDDGDLGAEARPHAGELAPDHAAAEHDHRGRHPVEQQRVLGGEDPLAVDLEAGQRPAVGAGGQHHVLPGVRRRAVGRETTVTSCGPVSRPSPSMTVMPRPLISPVRPLKSRETTLSL